MLRFIKLVRYQ